ncbi:TetR/AcrR family transcriptional regulator [Streptomyces sp. 900116325]
MHAFAQLEARRAAELDAHDGRRDAARQGMIDHYLSTRHRDNAGDGCPTAALAADMARDAGDAAHDDYIEGVRDFAQWLATDDEDGLARLATLVGALLLARATNGSPLSDEILHATHAALSDDS